MRGAKEGTEIYTVNSFLSKLLLVVVFITAIESKLDRVSHWTHQFSWGAGYIPGVYVFASLVLGFQVLPHTAFI